MVSPRRSPLQVLTRPSGYPSLIPCNLSLQRVLSHPKISSALLHPFLLPYPLQLEVCVRRGTLYNLPLYVPSVPLTCTPLPCSVARKLPPSSPPSLPSFYRGNSLARLSRGALLSPVVRSCLALIDMRPVTATAVTRANHTSVIFTSTNTYLNKTIK